MSDAMKNLSTYVRYEDFLKIERFAIEYEKNGIYRKARKGDYRLLVRLLFFTGARISEVIGSKPRAFTNCLHPKYDRKRSNCSIWNKLGDDSACIECECPYFRTYHLKKHYGIRVKDVMLNERLIAIYGKHVNSSKLKPRTVIVDEETLDLIKDQINCYSLKPNDKILNLTNKVAMSFMRKVQAELQMPWVSCHKFRHGHAVYCIQNGMDIRTLQQQLGHASLSITAVYLQFATDERKKEYDRTFKSKPNHVKVQCPSCGFNFKLKKNRDIEFEDKLRPIFDK